MCHLFSCSHEHHSPTPHAQPAEAMGAQMLHSSSVCKFSSRALAFPSCALRASLLLAGDPWGHHHAQPCSSPGPHTQGNGFSPTLSTLRTGKPRSSFNGRTTCGSTQLENGYPLKKKIKIKPTRKQEKTPNNQLQENQEPKTT